MIDARYASLLAFAQSRGSDCGRDPDGKFGGGNKCAVVGGVLRPQSTEPHEQEPTFGDKDDDHVYHVTTQGNASSIVSGGFKQSGSTVKGSYETYSKGKVFFTEKSGLATWKSKIEDHLFHEHDDPPPVAIVRVKKSEVEHLLKPDEIGTKDAGSPAYYVDLTGKKKEGRAFCATGQGNGIDNSCSAKTMSAPDKDGGGGGGSPSPAKPDTWGDNTWAGDETPASLSHLGSIEVNRPRTEEDVAQLAGSMGITSPSDLLTIGACNIKDAEVEIDGLGMKILTMRADIPAGKGKIKIDTAIALEDSGPTINYGYLALDTAALTEAVNDPKVSSRYGGQIYGAMLASMETAEKAGFVSATTTAEGYGPGNTNGRRTDLQGYRLWGRFGFDGDIPKGWFARVASKDVDVESVLSPEANRSLKASGTVRLQQLLATKQGENIWKQWGVPIELEFDFTNKTSDGYKRYQDMLALSKRTKNRRSFFEYVYGLELRDDPSLWSGFVEQRVFCPNGEGNGVTNDCGPGQTAKSFPEGSQNLRDAVDSLAPAPDQVWNRSRGLAETPPAKQMDDIANEQTSNTGVALTPEAEASYGSLVDEIGRQYEALTAAGLKARAWRGDGEPYGDPPGSTKPNSDKMRQEVAKTGEFSFYMTDKGFGTGDATPDHPMLRETKFKTADGEPMIANDLFRVVHDMVAHVRGGYSFSTNGEYNGMLTHASTLPEAAWPALFAETFGQNAVYEKTKNYAPQNAYASKVGPEIIRSELKKRTKSSRATKKDGDEPLGYQHIKSRPALLKSLVEKRAFCATGDGNGIDNSCGAKVMMAPDSDAGGGGAAAPASPAVDPYDKFADAIQKAQDSGAYTDSYGNIKVIFDSSQTKSGVPFDSTTKAQEVEIRQPKVVIEWAKERGLEDPSDIAVIGCGTAPDASVQIRISDSNNGVLVHSTIPVGGRINSYAQIDVKLKEQTVNYMNFGLSGLARTRISEGEVKLPFIAASVMSVMSRSLEAAERNGYKAATTAAAGEGTGSFGSGPDGDLKGYRLWPKFGFDGEVDSDFTRSFLSATNPATGNPFRYDLNPQEEAYYGKHEAIRVQHIIRTPQGEAWWNAHGYGMLMELDFTDKSSPGYRRYQRMAETGRRMTARLEKQGRSAFEFWLWAAESAGGIEFRGCEQALGIEFRDSDCGRDDDGRFSSGNKCGGHVEMPKEDPRGRMRYESGVQTDAARKLYQMGTSEKKLKGLVETLGGDVSTTRADINPPSVDLTVADKDGNKLFHIEVQNGRARLYPTKDLSDDELGVIKNAASEAFAGRDADTKIKVFAKASDMKSWEKENAAKIKAWDDKYRFSVLLPPHERPKKWERSLDARYASLLAFAEARDCGQDNDGKFSKGNTCASGIAADAAKGAAKGAALGALAGFAKTFLPQVAASNAAVGAVAGAVKGIYDNQMKPTRVSNRIKTLGMTDEGVANIVKSLGGSKNSVASTTGRTRLTVKIKNRDGKVTHVVDFTNKTLTIYPKKAGKELSDSELQAVKDIASANAPKQTKFTVKTDSLSYVKRIARNGFEVSASKAGIVIATAAVSAFGSAVPDVVGGVADFYFDTHFTDSFYRRPNAKR